MKNLETNLDKICAFDSIMNDKVAFIEAFVEIYSDVFNVRESDGLTLATSCWELFTESNYNITSVWKYFKSKETRQIILIMIERYG